MHFVRSITDKTAEYTDPETDLTIQACSGIQIYYCPCYKSFYITGKFGSKTFNCWTNDIRLALLPPTAGGLTQREIDEYCRWDRN